MKFEIDDELFEKVLIDLRRKHEFACERMGYLIGFQKVNTIIFDEWFSFNDNLYIKNNEVGARIGPKAMANLVKKAFKSKKSFFILTSMVFRINPQQVLPTENHGRRSHRAYMISLVGGHMGD